MESNPINDPLFVSKFPGEASLTIDLNCDMGEGTGNEEVIMPFISSANISCGFHAGNEEIIDRTIKLAIRHHVAIGAHPSFFDRENFGRTEINLPPEELYDLVSSQLGVIDKIARDNHAKLHHVKPHGALYNMSARNAEMAKVIARAVRDFNPDLILFGLCESLSIREGKAIGLRTANEVFADRTYQDDGNLTPRSLPNAMIENADKCIEQALQMVKKKMVTSVNGKNVSIIAETICIHGDGKNAVPFAKAIHENFQKEGIQIKALS